MKQFFQTIFDKIKNKKIMLCIVIVAAFIVYMLFFDAYNIISRVENSRKITQLENEINYYEQLIENDKQHIHELQSDDKNLEKFAREQFLMKRDNEDIFIVEEE